MSSPKDSQALPLKRAGKKCLIHPYIVLEQMRRARNRCHAMKIRDMYGAGSEERVQDRVWYQQSIIGVKSLELLHIHETGCLVGGSIPHMMTHVDHDTSSPKPTLLDRLDSPGNHISHVALVTAPRQPVTDDQCRRTTRQLVMEWR